MEALFGLIGVIIGSIITVYIFRKERQDKFNLSAQERKDKYRLIAIEKRLEAHQKALKQWEILQSVIHSPDNKNKSDIISNVREFWLNNCLYLEKITREKFKEAIWIVSSYTMWLEMYRDMDPGKEKDDHKKFYMGCWEDFHKLFETIQKEVELEPIKPEEDKTPEGETIKKEIKKN